MGRRLKSTKGGRFINPADAERKANRKRELKKNKKQRGMVRTAVLKSKDADDIIIQMQKLDQMEFDTNIPCPLPQRVVQEKRLKLRETFLRVLGMYKKEEDEPEKFNEMKKKLQTYDMLRAEMEQNFAAFKFAKESNPAEIPLPDGLAGPGAAQTPAAPEPTTSSTAQGNAFPSHMILPEFRGIGPSEPPHGILRKHRKKSDYPPGPPIGAPPELSDSEGSDNDSEGSGDEGEERAERRSRVRFADGVEDGEEKDTRTKYKRLAKKLAAGETANEESGEQQQQQLPPSGPLPQGAPMNPPPMLRHPVPGAGPLFPQGHRLMRPPPPPPGMPPRLLMPGMRPAPMPPSGMMPGAPRMGMMAQRPPPGIGPQIVAPPPTNAAVIQAGPTINKRTGPIIEGKPQLRNMQKEVTRLVPTALKVKRDGDKKKPKPQYSGGLMMSGGENPAKQGGQSKDTAYDEFMSEIAGLL